MEEKRKERSDGRGKRRKKGIISEGTKYGVRKRIQE